jgi:hypothetical protein
VRGQPGPRYGAEEVELAANLDSLPVREPEMGDDELLPLGLLGRAHARKAQRHRNWLREPALAGHADRQGQHRRGVEAAREAHHAGRSLERGEDRLGEGLALAAVAGGGEVCRGLIGTDRRARGELPAGECERSRRVDCGGSLQGSGG